MAAPIRVALLHSVVSDYGNDGRQISNIRAFQVEEEESFFGLFWELEEPLAYCETGSSVDIVKLEQRGPDLWAAIAQTETEAGTEALVRYFLERIERPDREEPFCYRLSARCYIDIDALDPELAE